MRPEIRDVTAAPSESDVLGVIAHSAGRRGIETYLVGGFVRDRLLGRQGKDIDLLTIDVEGGPLLSDLAERFGWSRPQFFERFGTGQVRGDGFVVEVVRARAERYDPTSRRPSVRPGTLDDDIWRRDFTVNALCQTLEGRVIDRTGRGLDDLWTGVLRTPLDPRETFSEDPLRMFRAARFVAQLGFHTAPGLIEAMTREAHRATILSAERVSGEFRRLLTSQHPLEGLDVLRDGGLCAVVLPELAAMVGVEQGGYHTHDVWGHSVRAAALIRPDIVLRTAALLHDVGKPPTRSAGTDGRPTFHHHPQVGAAMARELLVRLRYGNDEIRDITALVALHMRPILYRGAEWGDAAVRRLIRDAGPLGDHLIELARADTAASAFPTIAELDDLAQRMQRLNVHHAVSTGRVPLDGRDIMELGGRGPGPWVGRVMAALRDAIVDGDLAPDDADAARDWLRTRPQLLGDH